MSRIFDTHVHIDKYAAPEPQRLLSSMDKHHIDKVALLAEDPEYTLEKDLNKCREYNEARLARLMQWCNGSDKRLVPIYYINPVERDALEQVEKAVNAGCAGFKVICETHYPGDERAMPVYQRIADMGKSILFHSGILWDWGANSNYNRPCNFECMFGVANAKFALAHISWPWTDECNSVYGKFTMMWDHPSYQNQVMYVDLTPGTPECYRQDALNTLHDTAYWGLENRMLFGSDLFTSTFDAAFIAELAKSDTEKLLKAGYSQEVVDNILYNNAMEFWGLKD